MLEFPLVLVIFLGIQTFVTFSIFSYQYSPLYKTHNTYFKWMVFMVFTKTVFLFTIGLISCFYEVHQCNPIEYILHNTVLIMDLFLCRDMLSVVTPPTKTNIQIVNLISTHSFVIIATIICFIDPFKQSYILLGTSSFISSVFSFFHCSFEMSIFFLLWSFSYLLYGIFHAKVSMYYEAVLWSLVLFWFLNDKHRSLYHKEHVLVAEDNDDLNDGDFETIELH